MHDGVVPFLMKSYMDMEKVHVIPHVIKVLPDLRAFVSDLIPNGNDKPIGNTPSSFYRGSGLYKKIHSPT